ncbi:MAG: UvrD-helicase domain-containing protein [Alistipes senegalensis]|nr:UvrD-helicase domain-containing protein [Bacteroides cellulosilyticus]MCM1352242.1 UvrD-helicase domain-containing protein [Alistipes senegalensis]
MKAKILNASAGSGKTYQLAYKYVHDVVEQPLLYRHILAVTFTNKATEEMKSRILKEIHLLASGADSSYLESLCRELKLDAATVRKRAAEARSKILHDYSHFTVLTIDTFFQRILRAFIKELGLDLNYNVEIETASVLTKSADALIEQITVDKKLLHWLTAFVQERIDDGEKWDVRSSILSLGQELFKEKNKETLSTMRAKEELARIVHEATAHAEATKGEYCEAARRMLAAIEEAGLSEKDFTRGFPVKYLRDVVDGKIELPGKTIRNQCVSTSGWCNAKSPALPYIAQLQPLLRSVCDIYDRNIRHWNTCALLRNQYRSFALLSDLYARVKRMCDEQNLMLLSETKYILSEFIAHNDAPFIYEKVGNRFARFMIDEFQDTSIKEWENFLPLLTNAMSQSDETSVFIVGDIKQSIYRWRGGDWEILQSEARRALGTGNTETVSLQDNFRSLPVVVEFNNRVIGDMVAEDNRTLNAMLETAVENKAMSAADAESLRDTLVRAYRNHEQRPRLQKEHPGYVSVELFDEKPPVVERICQLIDKGFRPCDILILVRGTADGARVASDLLDFKRNNTDARYRFDVVTREALQIGTAPVSQFIISVLRLSLNDGETYSRAGYNHFLGRAFDCPLGEDEKLFFRSLRMLSPEDAFERTVMRYGLQHAEQQTAYLQAIHEQLISFCADRIADIPLFLRWWDEQGSKRSLSVERSESAVEIMTVHKAKGLEQKAVIIPYCAWSLEPKNSGWEPNIVWAEADGDAGEIGRFPVRYGKTMSESDFSAEYYRERVYSHVDNINLLYVALTRAAESLHVFIPRKTSGNIPLPVGKLLWRVLTASDADLCDRYECGTFSGSVATNANAEKPEHVVLKDYPTAQADLRLRWPTQRYSEEGERELSPRNFGIMMHRAFQEAETSDDIRTAIRNMQSDALLSEADAVVLLQKVEQAFENPLVREWFDGSWDRVRNENTIIRPMADLATSSDDDLIKRPDRVMLKGERAIVVDYKFGKREGEEAGYRRQIRRYLDLIRRMGYSECEGYLWYVKRGEIEKVE